MSDVLGHLNPFITHAQIRLHIEGEGLLTFEFPILHTDKEHIVVSVDYRTKAEMESIGAAAITNGGIEGQYLMRVPVSAVERWLDSCGQ